MTDLRFGGRAGILSSSSRPSQPTGARVFPGRRRGRSSRRSHGILGSVADRGLALDHRRSRRPAPHQLERTDQQLQLTIPADQLRRHPRWHDTSISYETADPLPRWPAAPCFRYPARISSLVDERRAMRHLLVHLATTARDLDKPRPLPLRLCAEELLDRASADREPETSPDLPMYLHEAHRTLCMIQDLQSCCTRRPESQFAVARPIATFSLHTGHFLRVAHR